MKTKRPRKQRPNVSIDQYLGWCQDEITIEQYLQFEKKRVNKLFEIEPMQWVTLLKRQNLKCYYCETELNVIQQLILKGFIKPRKRGPDSYSGLHFELDHKNCDKKDNCPENIVASCYYCNNDKSNTIDSDTFKKYFGVHKKNSFKFLCQAVQLNSTDKYRHNLKGKPNSFA